MPYTENAHWSFRYFHDWQALFAGLFALIAAVFTGNIAKNNHDDLVYKKRLSAKAHMHDAVDEISTYLQEMFNALWAASNEFPEKPVSGIKVLKDNIGYFDKNTVEAISIFLRDYQVFNACFRAYDNNRVIVRSERITEITGLFSQCDKLLLLARDEIKEIASPEVYFDEAYSRLRISIGNYNGDRAYNLCEEPYFTVIECMKRYFKSR